MKYDLAKEVAHFGIDFARQVQRVVIHRQEDAPELKPLRMNAHHLANYIDHLCQPLHGEVLTLDGHQHLGRAGQSSPRKLA